MRAFYCENIPPIGGIAILSNSELKHLFNVLRASFGDEIILLDGNGKVALAKIAKDKAVIVESVKEYAPPNVKISLCVSPPRHSGMDDIIAFSCETAVSEIYPIICERSVAFPRNLEKWTKRLIEACKQSKNPFFPKIHPPIKLKDAVVLAKDSDSFYGDPYNGGVKINAIKTNNLFWFVGPEGGFSDAEIKIMKDSAFRALKISPVVMRVETAALAGIILLQSENAR